MNIRANTRAGHSLFILAMLAPGYVTPSLAAGAYGPDVTVGYADINVDTVEGATVLLTRIKAAATRVCAPLDHGDLASRATRDACRGKLTAAAVAQMDRPVLKAVYESSRPASPSIVALTE